MFVKQRPLVPERLTFRPMSHPELFDSFKRQVQMFWTPLEVPMGRDVRDLGPNGELTEDEKEIIKTILRFFTQGDIRVAQYYLEDVIPYCKIPEAQMCFSAFAFQEAIHVWAYSHLNDTLGLPDKDFSAFLEYQEMVDKLDILDNVSNKEDALVKLGVFSGFMEGVSLFGSFALLLNLSRFGLMNGVAQIVSWSVRDENLHVTTMCSLFRRLLSDLEEGERYFIEAEVIKYGKLMVEAEFKFIDSIFGGREMRGINAPDLKNFILELANKRLGQLGMAPEFRPEVNGCLRWFDEMTKLPESANFFEAKVTSYERAGEGWDD